MGRCEKYREQIAELALGALPDGECAEVKAHAAECGACATLLEETMALMATLKSAELPEPRAEFSAGLADRVYGELKKSGAAPGDTNVIPMRRGSGHLKTLSALAAMLLLAVGFLFVMKGMRGGEDPAANLPTDRDFTETEIADEVARMMGSDSIEIVLDGVEVEATVDFNELSLAFVFRDADLGDEDMEWLEAGLAGSDENYTDDFDVFFDNITEEEAREILEGLENSGTEQTAVPRGVS